MDFFVEKTDKKARAGRIKTAHSEILTPVFMPVGTAAVIKGLDALQVKELGAKIILANTYHLYLRPGSSTIKNMGGLHGFTSYDGSFLTDSGGFQAFSLSQNTKHADEGIEFKSHIDGSRHLFTPKSVLDAQYDFNSDIMMILDDLIALPASKKRLDLSVERTIKWAKEASLYHAKQKQAGKGLNQNIFGIIQGGTDYEARRHCALALGEMGFDGLAIGGLSVGEENAKMYDTIEGVVEFMDTKKPRYLMGVGTPKDLLEGIERGVDMFDCVMPTRNARNASLFTSCGKINIKNARFKQDLSPLDENCDCHTCKNFSKGYLHHLFKAHELTFYTLASIHNLRFYLNLMRDARRAILAGEFARFKQASVYN